MTTEIFIERAKLIHGDKYNYSKVEYIDSKTEVCIICPEHGEFMQKPQNHLRGYGCKKCQYESLSQKYKSNTDEFIDKCIKKYGNKYDYSLVVYEKSSKKVNIICRKHGIFKITPNDFLDGHICPKCAHEMGGNKISNTTEVFIAKAIKKHGNKYIYDKVKYYRNENPVCIICPEHGEFWQTPHSHLAGNGCPMCGKISKLKKRSLTTEDFINRSKKIHGDYYDYSKVDYRNAKTKVCIVCPIHGEFWQRPCEHLNGSGCAKCGSIKSGQNSRLTTKEYIKRAEQKFGELYDYSKAIYNGWEEKLTIICPKHGEFVKRACDHLHGQGCPHCNHFKLEQELIEFFNEKGIMYEHKKRDFSWLKVKKSLELDFYDKYVEKTPEFIRGMNPR